MPRYDDDWIDSMLQTERRGSPPAEETLAMLDPRPGDTVADVGCGPGFYTLAAARLIAPTGVVYAVDVEPRMLALVRQRAAAAGLGNVETLTGVSTGVPLDRALADVALCGLLLHDLSDRRSMIGELKRILRPGGRVVVTEWLPEPGDTRPNRLTPEQTAGLLDAAGLRVVDCLPLGTKQYLIVARSPAAESRERER